MLKTAEPANRQGWMTTKRNIQNVCYFHLLNHTQPHKSFRNAHMTKALCDLMMMICDFLISPHIMHFVSFSISLCFLPLHNIYIGHHHACIVSIFCYFVLQQHLLTFKSSSVPLSLPVSHALKIITFWQNLAFLCSHSAVYFHFWHALMLRLSLFFSQWRGYLTKTEAVRVLLTVSVSSSFKVKCETETST